MSYETILYEERDGVAVITFNRPDKRNALNVPLVRETMDATRKANASDAVGAILIQANGTVFSAGVDFKAPPEPKGENGRSPTPATISMGQDEGNWLKLLQESKPSVVAVNGAAIGMGATFILGADIRVMGESGSFSFPFLKLKAMPEIGGSAMLTRLVGYGRAMDIVLRSAVLDAQESVRVGLATSIYPDASLREEAMKIAIQIAGYPPLQRRLTKKMLVDNAVEGDANMIMRREGTAFIEMFKAFKTTKTQIG